MHRAALVVTALSLVFACKASEPAEQQASKDAAPASTPTSEVATPSEAAPTPTPDAAANEAAPPSESIPNNAAPGEAAPADVETPGKNLWWCVCYDGTTECRPNQTDCQAFAKTIGDELTHGCRTLAGDHPGDATESREVWEESETPGGWVSESGLCLLGGRKGHDAGAPTNGDPFAILDNESIGGLRLKMSATEIVALLGEPSERDKIGGPFGEGEFNQGWTYADSGMQLVLTSSTRKGTQTLWSITVSGTPKTTVSTKRGMQLGSRWKDVEAAYADALYLEDEGLEQYEQHTGIVAGSIFGGLTFGFDEDQDGVTSLHLGRVAD